MSASKDKTVGDAVMEDLGASMDKKTEQNNDRKEGGRREAKARGEGHGRQTPDWLQ